MQDHCQLVGQNCSENSGEVPVLKEKVMNDTTARGDCATGEKHHENLDVTWQGHLHLHILKNKKKKAYPLPQTYAGNSNINPVAIFNQC